jgi:pantetheine-phosphate adenylyltransferase
MTIKKAIYAGTFDPFTNGHHDILERSLEIFDEVTVLVAVSPTKAALFSMDERVAMLREHFAKNRKVKVEAWDGLIVDYAKKKRIGAIVRGLRPTGDFEIEFQMASMNQKLYPDLETVFLMTRGKNYFISSTLVREVFRHGGDVTGFVPSAVNRAMKKLKKKN